jgi:hypothetical protein
MKTLRPATSRLLTSLAVLLPLSLLIGCDSEGTSDADPGADSGADLGADAALADAAVEATTCDFSTIAGTWTGIIPLGEHQSLTLEAQADVDASIGTTVFSNDNGDALCTFDVQCKPSVTEGTFEVFNEFTEGGNCAEGWYTMALADQALVIDFRLTEDGPTIYSYELTQEE